MMSLYSFGNIPINERLRPLLDYTKEFGNIKDVEGFDNSILHIYSRKVLNMIRNNEDGWEEMVPKVVAKTIKKKSLFDLTTK